MTVQHGIYRSESIDIPPAPLSPVTNVLFISGTAKRGEPNKVYKFNTLTQCEQIFGTLDEQDEGHTIVRHVAAIMDVLTFEPVIMASTVGTQMLRDIPEISVGLWDDFTSDTTLKHTWDTGDPPQRASGVATGVRGGKKFISLSFEELTNENEAMFTVDVDGENWENVGSFKFDIKANDLPQNIPLVVQVVFATGQGGDWYRHEFEINSTEWENSKEINLKDSIFSTKATDWATQDQPLENSQNIRKVHFVLSLKDAPPAALSSSIDIAEIMLVPDETPIEIAAEDASVYTLLAGNKDKKTGVWAAIKAKNEFGLKPNIFVCPRYSENLGVAEELFGVAKRLQGFASLDRASDTDVLSEGDQTTEDHFRGQEESRRLNTVYPALKTRKYGVVGYSAIWAARRMETDFTDGFGVSCSNKVVPGIESLTDEIDFEMGRDDNTAARLNARLVTTMIRQNGFRVWGNRSLDREESPYSFITATRTADAIDEAFVNSFFWAVDQGMTEFFIEYIVDAMKDYLRSQINVSILGGDAWFDRNKNPVIDLGRGQIVFSWDFTPIPVAEKITINRTITNRYISTLFGGANAS